MTRNGKKATFTSLVVAGNKAGGVGYGLGRDSVALDSIVKAGKIAENNMEFFERFQGRTIFHAVNVKFKATRLMAKPAPASNFYCILTLPDRFRKTSPSCNSGSVSYARN